MTGLDKACITEIFSSIQGEGPFVGVRQIFVRFSKCNLKCYFCDEKKKGRASHMSAQDLMGRIKRLDEGIMKHHSISITGGEPLLHINFLKIFMPELKRRKFKVYLETNGTLPKEFKKIMEWVDIVAMDVKLPSATGLKAFWREHREFLRLARQKEVFIKAVVTDTTEKSDVKKAADLIRGIDKDLLLILQPATPSRKDKEISSGQLMDFLFLAEKRLRNVRIIPQIHKHINVR